MSALFTKYQSLLKQYRALQPLAADAQSTLDKKFRLEFNFNSNHMEGNTLTYAETELLLIFDGTKGNHELREYEEMKAHDVAWHLVQEWAKSDRILTEAEIKELNQVILVRPFWKDAITPEGQATRRLIQVGDYKEYPNSVRLQNGEIFEYASVIDTPIKMGELMHWFHTALQSAELDPVLIAARLHYDFVRIHPFDDGNGRISRLLMNYVLLRFDLPPVIIKSKDKAAYLRALNRADTGDFEAFADYVVEQLNWSLDLCLKAGRGESVEEDDDLDKEIAVLNKQLKTRIFHEIALKDVNKHQFIQELAIPLFKEIDVKIASLEENFLNPMRKVEIRANDSRFHEVTLNPQLAFEDRWQFAKNETVMSVNNELLSNVETVRFILNLQGLKSSKAAQNVYQALEVSLRPFHFQLSFNQNLFHFPYGQISEFEKSRRDIVKEFIQQVIETIKRSNIG